MSGEQAPPRVITSGHRRRASGPRPKGTGGVVELRQGLWRVDVEISRDPLTGRRRRVSRRVRGSREDAEAALAKLRVADHEGRLPRPGTKARTVRAALDAYVRDAELGVVDLAPKTVVTTRSAANTISKMVLLDAEAAAGVAHHVALSVVGTDRLSASGYFRAKIAQENLIANSSIPYSIVHATQFFEFIKSIAQAATDGDTVRLAPVLIQPVAADDVAAAVGKVSVGAPLNGIVEVAGPEQFRLDELMREFGVPLRTATGSCWASHHRSDRPSPRSSTDAREARHDDGSQRRLRDREDPRAVATVSAGVEQGGCVVERILFPSSASV